MVFWCKTNGLLYGSNHCKSYYNSPCWNSDCWQVYKYNNCFYIYQNGTAYKAQNIFDLKNVLHGHSFSSNALILLFSVSDCYEFEVLVFWPELMIKQHGHSVNQGEGITKRADLLNPSTWKTKTKKTNFATVNFRL